MRLEEIHQLKPWLKSPPVRRVMCLVESRRGQDFGDNPLYCSWICGGHVHHACGKAVRFQMQRARKAATPPAMLNKHEARMVLHGCCSPTPLEQQGDMILAWIFRQANATA